MRNSRRHNTGRWARETVRRGCAAGGRGFTITELLVVATIVLTVTLAAVGAYANLRRSRTVRTAAEGIQASLVAARAYAITTNGTYRVVVQLRDPATGQPQAAYWIDEVYRGDEGAPITNLPTNAKTPKVSTPDVLPEDVSILGATVTQLTPTVTGTATPTTNNYAVIRFFPDGSSDAATIQLVREGETTADASNPHAYTIQLQAPTAKAKIIAAERQ